MRRPAFVVLVLTLAAFAHAGESEAEFPRYAGARALCQEHVMANHMEVHWQSFASTDAPANVLAFYAAQLGDKGKPDGVADGIEWRHAKNANARLTVYPATKADKYPACTVRATAADKTIIMFATATRF